MEKLKQILLLNDLCARLPYRVQMRCFDLELNEDYSYTGNKISSDQTLFGINLLNVETEYTESSPVICVDGDGQEGCYSLDNAKPYLRPLSSMTAVEKKELEKMGFRYDSYDYIINEDVNERDDYGQYYSTSVDEIRCSEVTDFLRSHHFDHLGLIPKNLALEAPAEMYKID